ncbi:uncharacterized protein LOC114536606 [Dendronephthya gigantea]|uniref:uncharacterized protein LOC114536606 n=1 Tax=Dendronephthya gigantea TaxID=151771 RepID=UPI001069812B|nr:uncharacterized protein LOC114536606 [Dendronephthya gigantea]XP_028413771.1 uncharacterized protein LOC114536606 [Dendronephthya gigantea]
MAFLSARSLAFSIGFILVTTPLRSMINAQPIMSTMHDSLPSATNFLEAIDEPIANSLNARNFGVLGDGITDDSRAIQTFINNASLDQKIAFFPSGEYIISENIWIDGSVSIQGSSRGITVLKTPRTKILQIYIGNKMHGLRDLSITHIFFDGITLYFSSKRFKHNFHLANCLFFTSRQPLLPIEKASISWQRVANGIISNVVILRSKETHAVGVSFYKTKHVRVESCIFGLDFNNLTWLATQYHGIDTWTSLIEKLHFTKGHY